MFFYSKDVKKLILTLLKKLFKTNLCVFTAIFRTQMVFSMQL
jgi:hypothetical protein